MQGDCAIVLPEEARRKARALRKKTRLERYARTKRDARKRKGRRLRACLFNPAEMKLQNYAVAGFSPLANPGIGRGSGRSVSDGSRLGTGGAGGEAFGFPEAACPRSRASIRLHRAL